MNRAKSLRVLVVGCGHKGSSHAKAYANLRGFEICGLVSRNPELSRRLNATLDSNHPVYEDFLIALRETAPDAVCICTYPDTHARYARVAMDAGCHVFLEKPMAVTASDARDLIAASKDTQRKLVIGYILQHHPTWIRFVREARKLGKPLVMRMNLNQQSSADTWRTHQNILKSMSPIVDCGVHYVDVMCRMAQAKPVQVYAQGARMSGNLADDAYNYGMLQIRFDDGSMGWYEAGWGPMMSQTAFFVKDVIGPRGSVSIVDPTVTAGRSDNIEGHTRAASLVAHDARLSRSGEFAAEDRMIHFENDPGHDGLCFREQAFFLDAIRKDLDLTDHLAAAYDSLRIVLAADESVRKGRVVRLA